MSWLPSWCTCCCSCPINCSTPTMSEEVEQIRKKQQHIYEQHRPPPLDAPLETARGPRTFDYSEFATAIGNNPQTQTPKTDPKPAKSKRHRKLESTDIMDISQMMKWDEASYNKYIQDRAKLANEKIGTK